MAKASGGTRGGGASARSAAKLAPSARDRVVGILKENRDSVISQIKWSYRDELRTGEKTLKGVMEDAVDKAVKEPQWTANEKRMKTNLRDMVKNMHGQYVRPKMEAARKAKEEYNLKKFGTKHPKLADLISGIDEVTGTDSYTDWHVHKFGFKPKNRF